MEEAGLARDLESWERVSWEREHFQGVGLCGQRPVGLNEQG